MLPSELKPQQRWRVRNTLQATHDLIAQPYGWAKGVGSRTRWHKGETVTGRCLYTAVVATKKNRGLRGSSLMTMKVLEDYVHEHHGVTVVRFNDRPETRKRDMLNLLHDVMEEVGGA